MNSLDRDRAKSLPTIDLEDPHSVHRIFTRGALAVTDPVFKRLREMEGRPDPEPVDLKQVLLDSIDGDAALEEMKRSMAIAGF